MHELEHASVIDGWVGGSMMIDSLQSMAARSVGQAYAVDETMRAGLEFALEKRQVDAGNALESAHGRMTTELVNSLRQLTAQLKP
ncbi:hypothetical protein C0Z20_03340 [Trinickia symbiotica]|uniref:Uncharacterized protein n=2 Tax=Trinickia symbiotica TaxID=863227 RepID=A0A2N7X8D9_9BURK|nr:hypothetical protein C0Z20_03340 [Trinickia symbiotica]